MTIRLHDTLDRRRSSALVPLEPGHVRIYSCGPTVYGPAHIGNFRSFLFADLLVRYLRYRGLRVTWVMNITDVDDKIIRGAAAEGDRDRRARRALHRPVPGRRGDAPDDDAGRPARGRPPTSRRWSRSSRRCWRAGTPTGPTTAPIFFRIASWPAYGRLAAARSRRDAGRRAGRGRRVLEGRRPRLRPLEGAPSPASPAGTRPIGSGRPGWHLECSAMSMAYLGQSFDIHTGGVDLIFPHHEDEIAQSEAATGQPFVRTWLHCAHLQMGGREDGQVGGQHRAGVGAPGRPGVAPRALRYALIAAHYRTRPHLQRRIAELRPLRRSIGWTRSSPPSPVYGGDGRRRPRPPGRRSTPRAASFSGRDGRRPRHLRRPRGRVRAGPRREPADRRAVAVSTADAGRALDALRDLDAVLGMLPDAVEPTLDADLAAAARRARRCPRGARLGRVGSPAGRAGRRAGSPSRIRATGNAGGASGSRRVPEPPNPRRPRRDDGPPWRRAGPHDRARWPGQGGPSRTPWVGRAAHGGDGPGRAGGSGAPGRRAGTRPTAGAGPRDDGCPRPARAPVVRASVWRPRAGWPADPVLARAAAGRRADPVWPRRARRQRPPGHGPGRGDRSPGRGEERTAGSARGSVPTPAPGRRRTVTRVPREARPAGPAQRPSGERSGRARRSPRVRAPGPDRPGLSPGAALARDPRSAGSVRRRDRHGGRRGARRRSAPGRGGVRRRPSRAVASS